MTAMTDFTDMSIGSTHTEHAKRNKRNKRNKQLRWVILDRDGVINEDSRNYVKSVKEWRTIPGSLQAITRLNKAGIKVFVATNQAGISKGYYTQEILAQIHQHLQQQLATVGGFIEDIVHCPHTPQYGCACRKPKPGLLLELIKRHDLIPSQLCFIGDSYTDYQAAQAADIDFYAVKTGKGAESFVDWISTPPTLKQTAVSRSQMISEPTSIAVYDSLAHWVATYLGNQVYGTAQTDH